MEINVPNGPYPNIENTGNDLSECFGCNDDLVMAMCWDGSNPGIAFTDGLNTEVASLPHGIIDPDIIIGNHGQTALVVYEQSGNIYTQRIELTMPVNPGCIISMGSPVLQRSNGTHPNIDINYQNNIALIYQNTNPALPNDIYYNVGDLKDPGLTAGWTLGWTGGDNKNIKISQQLNNGYCFWPDIAISGNYEKFGVHITFIERVGAFTYWCKMDHLLYGLSGKNWSNYIKGTGTSSDFDHPRISTTKSVFNANMFDAVVGEYDNTGSATDLVFNVADNAASSLAAISTLLFSNSTITRPAVAWVDDDKINAVWSGSYPTKTDDPDIYVKRLDQTGTPHDNTWAQANHNTQAGLQYNPSIAGIAALGDMTPTLSHFGYLWRDDANALWFKIRPAADAFLKQQPESSKNLTAKVYPNPAVDYIEVMVQDVAKNNRLELTDLLGNTIIIQPLRGMLTYIDVQQLAAGIYTLTVTNGDNTQVEKVVIQ